VNVYLDSSVVLRRLQRERSAIVSGDQWEHTYSSELLRIEVLRSIDRNRLKGFLKDEDVAGLVTRAHTIFNVIELVALSPSILNRASQSFLTPLGTLDALHLATALLLVEAGGIELTFLTHDVELATTARSMNFKVDGA
jgi:predicted nucleic acid-binding protein